MSGSAFIDPPPYSIDRINDITLGKYIGSVFMNNNERVDDYKLDVILYKDFCKALEDDYEGVRRAALKLVHVMSCAYPEHLIKVSNHNSNLSRNHQNG